jgi:hypothetical protein
MKRRHLLSLAAATMLAAAVPHAGLAETPILTVNDLGRDTTTLFSDADLAALPQQSFATATIWTEEMHTFSGPSLATILEAAGAGPARLRVYAINDYNVEFPTDQIRDNAPILANRIDGESFPVRRKGPLWLIFPFDQEPEYQSEEIFALSVWQVKRIDILPD